MESSSQKHLKSWLLPFLPVPRGKGCFLLERKIDNLLARRYYFHTLSSKQTLFLTFEKSCEDDEIPISLLKLNFHVQILLKQLPRSKWRWLIIVMTAKNFFKWGTPLFLIFCAPVNSSVMHISLTFNFMSIPYKIMLDLLE